MTIEERFARLERRCRALQFCMFVLLPLVAGINVMAQTKTVSQKIVEAQQFLLRDAAGRRIAVLGDFGGRAGLGLWGTPDAPGFVVGVGGDGIAALQLQSPSGVTVALAAEKSGAVIYFTDKTGKRVTTMGVDETGRFSPAK